MRIQTLYYADDGKSFTDEEECRAYEAERLRLGYQQWKFSFFFRCELKNEYKPVYKTCPSCHGTGKVGGGFKSFDGPQTCDECFGNGEVIDKEKTKTTVDSPPVPKDLNDAMVKTWNEWWKKFQQENV